MQQNEFGNRETDDFVALVAQNGSSIFTELFYISEDGSQNSGWVVLSPTEAIQLAATLIAVAGGYTQGKKAGFSVVAGSIISTSVGENAYPPT